MRFTHSRQWVRRRRTRRFFAACETHTPRVCYKSFRSDDRKTADSMRRRGGRRSVADKRTRLAVALVATTRLMGCLCVYGRDDVRFGLVRRWLRLHKHTTHTKRELTSPTHRQTNDDDDDDDVSRLCREIA